MKDYNKEIGAWLREKRKEKGYSVAYVTERMNKCKSSINYWESGERTIAASDFIDYCKVLGANPSELVDKLFK